mmetsp:Transcript_7578/g.16133  ORF Transcript_7578/g.16133 Transcript_7578/m.16133 type:complete len:110 (+) Transcript_7578:108-437(+)
MEASDWFHEFTLLYIDCMLAEFCSTRTGASTSRGEKKIQVQSGPCFWFRSGIALIDLGSCISLQVSVLLVLAIEQEYLFNARVVCINARFHEEVPPTNNSGKATSVSTA